MKTVLANWKWLLLVETKAAAREESSLRRQRDDVGDGGESDGRGPAPSAASAPLEQSDLATAGQSSCRATVSGHDPATAAFYRADTWTIVGLTN